MGLHLQIDDLGSGIERFGNVTPLDLNVLNQYLAAREGGPVQSVNEAYIDIQLPAMPFNASANVDRAVASWGHTPVRAIQLLRTLLSKYVPRTGSGGLVFDCTDSSIIIDGVTITTGQLIALNGQSAGDAPLTNGVYQVTGSASAWVITKIPAPSVFSVGSPVLDYRTIEVAAASTSQYLGVWNSSGSGILSWGDTGAGFAKGSVARGTQTQYELHRHTSANFTRGINTLLVKWTPALETVGVSVRDSVWRRQTDAASALNIEWNSTRALGPLTANTPYYYKLVRYHTAAPNGIEIDLSSVTPVTVAAISNGNVDTASNSIGAIDGVTLSAGNLILLKNQTNPVQNGIYVWSGGTITRTGVPVGWGTADAITNGAAVTAVSGQTNANRVWVCVSLQNTASNWGTGSTAWVRRPNSIPVIPTLISDNSQQYARFKDNPVIWDFKDGLVSNAKLALYDSNVVLDVKNMQEGTTGTLIVTTRVANSSLVIKNIEPDAYTNVTQTDPDVGTNRIGFYSLFVGQRIGQINTVRIQKNNGKILVLDYDSRKIPEFAPDIQNASVVLTNDSGQFAWKRPSEIGDFVNLQNQLDTKLDFNQFEGRFYSIIPENTVNTLIQISGDTGTKIIYRNYSTPPASTDTPPNAGSNIVVSVLGDWLYIWNGTTAPASWKKILLTDL
jgi:hypothetical protein